MECAERGASVPKGAGRRRRVQRPQVPPVLGRGSVTGSRWSSNGSFHFDNSQSTGDVVVGRPECKCHVCGKVTHSEASLRQHFGRVHRKQPGQSAVKGMECKVECVSEGAVKCPLCNKSLASKRCLSLHIKYAHGYLGYGDVARDECGGESVTLESGGETVEVESEADVEPDVESVASGESSGESVTVESGESVTVESVAGAESTVVCLQQNVGVEPSENVAGVESVSKGSGMSAAEESEAGVQCDMESVENGGSDDCVTEEGKADVGCQTECPDRGEIGADERRAKMERVSAESDETGVCVKKVCRAAGDSRMKSVGPHSTVKADLRDREKCMGSVECISNRQSIHLQWSKVQRRCDVCSKTFKNIHAVNVHKRMIHEQPNSSQTNKVPQPNCKPNVTVKVVNTKKAPVKCLLCETSVATKEALHFHIRHCHRYLDSEHDVAHQQDVDVEPDLEEGSKITFPCSNCKQVCLCLLYTSPSPRDS